MREYVEEVVDKRIVVRWLSDLNFEGEKHSSGAPRHDVPILVFFKNFSSKSKSWKNVKTY
jgi:hypothetical protein